ncbi:MAG: NUDIX domain-containing protein [Actinomycetaceae bacterium]|nr:NUDIX domain-containing protein [Actinomycetaceae bacterium]
MPTDTNHIVAAAIVDDPKNPTKILAAARAYPPELRGKLELPGGKQQTHETPTSALHREIAEELNITVRIHQEITPPPPITPTYPKTPPKTTETATTVPTVLASEANAEAEVANTTVCSPSQTPATWPLPGGKTMRVWVAEIASGRPQKTSAHLELTWLPLAGAPAANWLEPDLPIIAALQKSTENDNAS